MRKVAHAVTSDLLLGPRNITEAILGGQSIDKVWLAKETQGAPYRRLRALLQEHDIPFRYVPLISLRQYARERHQGAVAHIAPIPFASLSHVVQAAYEKGQSPLVVLLDGVTDVRNFGAIVRVATCAGAHAVVVPHHGSVAINSDSMKTSAGALAHLPICRAPTLRAVLPYLQASGLQIVACHEKALQSIFQTDLRLPLALLFGSEGQGIAPQHLSLVDTHIAIPMQGSIGSLNVSTAVAVALYEGVRQRFSSPRPSS